MPASHKTYEKINLKYPLKQIANRVAIHVVFALFSTEFNEEKKFSNNNKSRIVQYNIEVPK